MPETYSTTGPKPESFSDATQSSQSSLCNTCAQGLRLDDRRAGGALEEPRNDGTPKLCFPLIGEKEKKGWNCWDGDTFIWKGGAQYEQQYITPPYLPELSDECKFCRTVKSVLLDKLGQREWWQTTATKIEVQVQYVWSGSKNEGCQLEFELSSLQVKLTHPELGPKRPEFGPKLPELGPKRHEIGLKRPEPALKHPELGNYCEIEFPIGTSSDTCQEWLHITGRPLDAESSFSPRNVKLIQCWLEQCNTDPECCRSAKREEFLPTRLLDVGAQGSGDPSIYLMETLSMAQIEHADRPLKYICLSYRWGAAEPPLKTTKDTIEDYKANIRIDSMPRVFRDAVLVTRTLGIRYLWIDSLCILQDCDRDWHDESAAMADVFSHCWMTIGAASTSSCHETLFYPRLDLSIDIEFQSSIRRSITGTVSILLLSKFFRAPLDACLENSTWDTRGWVWQEQVLPQRLLMFGEKMLHFRCHGRLLHEYGEHYSARPYIYRPTPARLAVNPTTFLRWTAVIENYSRRELSKGTDRLAAFSGFAKAVARELEHAGKTATYIAGVWLTKDVRMESQLFWLLETPKLSFDQLLRHHKDRQQYIAPSWSWIALNQPVNSRLNGTESVFKVVDHNIKPARSDPMVAVAPGSSITLSGRLRKIPGRPFLGLKSSHSPERTTENWWDAPYSGEEEDWRWWRNEWKQNVPRRIRYFLDWDPSVQHFAEGDSEDLLKLFLLTKCNEGCGRSATGLVLFPDVVDPNLFLRVGSFEIYGPCESPDWEESEVVII